MYGHISAVAAWLVPSGYQLLDLVTTVSLLGLILVAIGTVSMIPIGRFQHYALRPSQALAVRQPERSDHLSCRTARETTGQLSLIDACSAVDPLAGDAPCCEAA